MREAVIPFEIKYMEESGVVAIENSGALTRDELVRQSKEAINLLREKKVPFNSHRFFACRCNG